MKILLIDNAGLVSKNGRFHCVEGTGKFAAELVEQGAEVTMYGQKLEMPSSVSVFDIEAHGIKTAGLWRKNNKVRNYFTLYLYSLKYIWRSDFVYIFYPNAFRYLAFCCTLLGKKFGLYIRGDEGLQDKVSQKIYAKSSVVLTVSKMFSDMVNNVTGRSISETIRPMLSYDDRDIVKNREYKTKEKYELLFLCRIERQKGLMELMEAMNQLKKSGNNHLHLIVAGDGDFLKTAKNECKKMGMEEDITFLGGIYDNKVKADLYKKADLYVLPTYYNEGFPRTLYEAMIFGTPIITTFVGGIPALMKDGENCKRVETRSVDSLINTLIFAFNNYEEMGKMALKATNLVTKIVDRNRPSHAQQLYRIIQNYGK